MVTIQNIIITSYCMFGQSVWELNQSQVLCSWCSSPCYCSAGISFSSWSYSPCSCSAGISSGFDCSRIGGLRDSREACSSISCSCLPSSGSSWISGLRDVKILNLHFHVVLLAHNGFVFDFPVLLAEVERRPRQLAASIFEDHNIHFGDTLPLLRKI